jgi:hypothetical protein
VICMTSVTVTNLTSSLSQNLYCSSQTFLLLYPSSIHLIAPVLILKIRLTMILLLQHLVHMVGPLICGNEHLILLSPSTMSSPAVLLSSYSKYQDSPPQSILEFISQLVAWKLNSFMNYLSLKIQLKNFLRSILKLLSSFVEMQTPPLTQEKEANVTRCSSTSVISSPSNTQKSVTQPIITLLATHHLL